jgi:Na+-transporting methylmalonyl-CoA/oxaloacetate decarboxylase gamma subunit
MAEKKAPRAKKKPTKVVEETATDYSEIDEDLAELLREVDQELETETAADDAGEGSGDYEAVGTEATAEDESQSAADSAAEVEEVEVVGEPAIEVGDDAVEEEVADPVDSESDESADSNSSRDTPGEADEEPPHGLTSEEESAQGEDLAESPAEETSPGEPEPAPKVKKKAASQEVAAPARPSFFRRLWNRLTRKKLEATPALEPIAVAAKPVNLKRELAKKQAALGRAQKVAERESAEAEKLQERLDSQRDELERVRSWVEGLERSYFWNVRKTMAGNLDRAKADLRFYEESVENVELPERGDLVKHRMRFHKNFGLGLLIFGIPTGLLFFIPWFAEATMPVWLLEFLNSGFFSVMVAGLLALTAGIVGIIRRAGGKEKMTWWRMIRISAIVVAIPMVIFGISRIQEWLLTYVVPLIDRWFAAALTALGVSFFFYVLGILAYYYSGWSQFSRQVTEQLTRLDNVEKGYVHSQKEIRRLEALYQQTSDWLELLAHSLYRPWKVDPDWETSNELKITSETFPFALRVAHAVDSETSQIANLERLIGQRLMTQGWRNEAFEHSLAEIGKQMGFDEEHVTPEFLDADLPHQTNNSRALIKTFFEQSATTAKKGAPQLVDDAGPTKDGHARFSDNYLVEVARRRLRELIEKTQSSVLSEARPAVEQIVDDPLQDIRFDTSVIDSKSTAQDWDDFLKDALGYEEVMQPPLSTMTFTDEGALAKDPESAQTHILIPERLKASAPSPQSDSVKIHPLPDQGKSRSVELIVRLDVVGPVPFGHVRMVENATHRPNLPQTSVDDDDSEL